MVYGTWLIDTGILHSGFKAQERGFQKPWFVGSDVETCMSKTHRSALVVVLHSCNMTHTDPIV